MSVKREFTFDSGDGRTKIHAVEWRPEKGEIRGVLQIFHGMVEFIERYEETAEYLTERGFVVVGNDHLGHGRSIVSKEEYGFFCENDGNAVVLGDLRRLHEKAKKAIYTHGPCFLNVLSPCPRGWQYETALLPKVCQLAVDTCLWPMYEVEDGVWHLTYEPKKKLPIEDFLRPQGRFKHLFKPGNEHLIEQFQAEVDRRWEDLLYKCNR